MVAATIDLGDDTVLTCDVAVLSQPMAEQRFLRPTEVIVAIEIAETAMTRDMGFKRHKYAQAGIAHYWVIDAARSATHVFARPIDGDYADISTVAFGAPLAVPGTDASITL